MASELMAMPTEEVERLQRETSPVVMAAKALVVRDQNTRDEAMDFLKRVKGAMKKVAELFDPIDDTQKKARKAAIEARAKLDDPLKEAERTTKQKVLAFDQALEEKRLAEERRLQAEANERARKEQERLEKEAAKFKTPELREARLAEAAMVQAPVVIIAPQVEKTQGESTRKLWRARLVDKQALLRAAADGNQIAAMFLNFDQAAANKQATATKNALEIPGIVFYEESSMAVR